MEALRSPGLRAGVGAIEPLSDIEPCMMVARMCVRVGYVVHLHHVERGAQHAWRRACC